MKKIISLVMVAAMLLGVILSMTSCNTSDPSEMSSIVGTYQLTKKTSRHKNATEPTDHIEEMEIVSYLVVSGDGIGYYVYQDNETPLFCKQVQLNFFYDTDVDDEGNQLTTNNIKNIEYEDAQNDVSGRLYVQGKSHKLTNSVFPIDLGFAKNNYYRTTEYTKVSDDNTLAYVNAQLDTTLSYVPYEQYIMHGIYSNASEYGYIYYFIYLDMLEMKATFAYMKNDDREQVQEVYDMENYHRDDNGSYKFTIEETEYTFYDFRYRPELSFSVHVTLEDGFEYDSLARFYFDGEYPLEDAIANALYSFFPPEPELSEE